MKTVLISGVIGLLPWLVCSAGWAQSRATLEPPVIKATEGQITITAKFSNFDTAQKYRVGVGSAKGQLTGAQFSLAENGETRSTSATTFTQGHTSQWWNVPEIKARGYILEGRSVPRSGKTLTLTVVLPRSEADQLAPLYFFVSRDYGSGLWYLEDGVDITEAYW